MTNLGKLIVMVLFSTVVQANVTAGVDKNRVQRGETVTLTLAVSAETFTLPEITGLCGDESLQSTHRQTADLREGVFRKTDLYTYQFKVETSCVIQPTAIEADGIEYDTPAFEITVEPATAKRDGVPSVALTSSRAAAYVGEALRLEVTFKDGGSDEASAVEFVSPAMSGLWIKREYDVEKYQEGCCGLYTKVYLVVPQAGGQRQIDPVEVRVGYDETSLDSWGHPKTTRRWDTYYSNVVQLDIKALPQGVEIVGDFTIAMKVDSRSATAGQPLPGELVIEGVGNFEDLQLPLPGVEGVDIVAQEPIIEEVTESKERWRQRWDFVGDRDFVIPPVVLRYFDPSEQTVREIQTEAVAIAVSGGIPEPEHDAGEDATGAENRLLLMGMLAAGGIVLWLLWKKYARRSKRVRVGETNDKAILQRLLRHKDQPEVEAMILLLESHIYGDGKSEIDPKMLKALLKKYP